MPCPRMRSVSHWGLVIHWLFVIVSLVIQLGVDLILEEQRIVNTMKISNWKNNTWKNTQILA